ncbi:MAG: PP2C family protein-serine/threonine phosphatase, partial [Actinomycetales bacterium]
VPAARRQIWELAELAGLDVRSRLDAALTASAGHALEVCVDAESCPTFSVRCGSRTCSFPLSRLDAQGLLDSLGEAMPLQDAQSAWSPEQLSDWWDRQLHDLGRAFAALDSRLASFERAYERQRVAAETLQHALLPVSLPAGRDLTCAAKYLPATTGVRAGGDWYDAFPVGHGQVVLTVGDVTGHGLDAAAVMGRLRAAARAYATEGHGPSAVLARLSRLLQASSDDVLASALVATLDVRAGTLVVAGAGHPAPLLRRPNGEVETITVPSWPLLGIEDVTAPEELEVHVERGTTFAFYSDGLIERRGLLLDDGLARLSLALARTEVHDVPAAAAEIVTEVLAGREREDDTCLLLARYGAAPQRRRSGRAAQSGYGQSGYGQSGYGQGDMPSLRPIVRQT